MNEKISFLHALIRNYISEKSTTYLNSPTKLFVRLDYLGAQKWNCSSRKRFNPVYKKYLVLNYALMFQEAKNMFIKALDAYVQKCQELTSEIGKEKVAKPDNSSDTDNKKFQENEENSEANELEQMINSFTTLLREFADNLETI